MSLKNKLYTAVILLHVCFLSMCIVFREILGLWLIAAEGALLASLLFLFWLIRKGLQPLEYIDIFSSLLKEQEFTSRFSYLNQPDLDKLIKQFNIMLEKLHVERLTLNERQHVFERLMSESQIGIILLDFDNHISECNPASIRFFKSLSDCIESDQDDSIIDYEQVKPAFSLDKIEVNEHKLIATPEGNRLKVGNYRFRDRGFERSFYLIQEITSDVLKSQKEAYEKLIRLMSHEVNNTIAISNSLLESCLTFKDELTDSSRQDFAKAIEIVVNRTESLNQFMQGYSAIIKLPDPVKTQFNLSQMIDNLCILFYSECEKLNIKLHKKFHENIQVTADPHLIEQVLMNIVKNAIESIASNRNSRSLRKIQFELSLELENVRLLIVDSGNGISDDIKNDLFTPFFTTKESGQGVGLMLINEILTAHSFSYKLVNNSAEQGASFSILFAD